ncbi:hypothetical protein GQ457_01G044790 [Hibiscus cannabinus]
MECNKFVLLLVAMAVVLLASMPPTVTAARNEVMPFSIIVIAIANANIRNTFANIFSIDKPTENCFPAGNLCHFSSILRHHTKHRNQAG